MWKVGTISVTGVAFQLALQYGPQAIEYSPLAYKICKKLIKNGKRVKCDSCGTELVLKLFDILSNIKTCPNHYEEDHQNCVLVKTICGECKSN